MKRFLQQFIKSNTGASAIEFALVAPLMILLLFGGIELSRYIVITMDLDKTAYSMANMVAQYATASSDNDTNNYHNSQIGVQSVSDVFAQQVRMMGRYGDDTKEAAIVTSITVSGAQSQNYGQMVNWQISSHNYGGGKLQTDVKSFLNGAGPVIAPGNGYNPLNVTDGVVNSQLSNALTCENIIIAEAFYRYQPIIGQLANIAGFGLAERTITRRYFIHPRNGNLLDLPPGQAYNSNTGKCPFKSNGASPCLAGTAVSWSTNCTQAGSCNAATTSLLNDGQTQQLSYSQNGHIGAATVRCNNGVVVPYQNCSCSQ